MHLMVELNEHVEYLTEDSPTGKNHFIQGIFLQADIKNRNGRVYPLNVMESEVNRYTNDVVKNGRAYGELGHPEGPSINLDRVSHMIVELKKDGTNFIGKAKLTETPAGNIAKGLLNAGANLGVSSRGMGTLKTNNSGIMEVQNDFRLATAADIVADPSAPNAFVHGIMEGVEWVWDSVKGTWLEQRLDDKRKQLKTMTINEINERKYRLFESFLNSLSKKV